jgi:hypothetical protein
MDSKRKPWEYEQGSRVKRISAETWIIWSNMPIGPLWKVVALHCGVDPDSVMQADLAMTMCPSVRSPEWFYQQRIDLAVAHVKNGTLDCFERKAAIVQSDVRLPVYAAWAESMGAGHEVQAQFPRHPQTAIPTPVVEAFSATRWPWGSHETERLKLFAQVGEFWRPVSEGGKYDPTDPTTAPTNAMIENWLQQRGVRKTPSEVMATMLRKDGMSPGPRPYKS